MILTCSDMSALLAETHKFESKYMQPLCWPAHATDEQIEEATKDRSPITRASKIKAPILIMGGDVDPICPPNQNTLLADKIKESGTIVELKLYEGEGHIFVKVRSSQNLLAACLKHMNPQTIWSWKQHKLLPSFTASVLTSS